MWCRGLTTAQGKQGPQDRRGCGRDREALDPKGLQIYARKCIGLFLALLVSVEVVDAKFW